MGGNHFVRAPQTPGGHAQHREAQQQQAALQSARTSGLGRRTPSLNLGEFPANESRPMSQRQGEEGGILNIRGGGACRLRISCTVNDFHVEDNNQNIDEVTKQRILSCWKFARSPSFPLFIFPLHRLIVSNVSFVIGCP